MPEAPQATGISGGLSAFREAITVGGFTQDQVLQTIVNLR